MAKEQEAHNEKLTSMKRRVDDVVDKGLDNIFVAFKDVVNKVDLMCSGTQFCEEDIHHFSFYEDKILSKKKFFGIKDQVGKVFGCY